MSCRLKVLNFMSHKKVLIEIYELVKLVYFLGLGYLLVDQIEKTLLSFTEPTRDT